MRILARREHLNIVAVASLAAKTCHFVVGDLRDGVLFRSTLILLRFSELVGLVNLTTLGKNRIIISMLDLFLIASKILYL